MLYDFHYFTTPNSSAGKIANPDIGVSVGSNDYYIDMLWMVYYPNNDHMTLF